MNADLNFDSDISLFSTIKCLLKTKPEMLSKRFDEP